MNLQEHFCRRALRRHCLLCVALLLGSPLSTVGSVPSDIIKSAVRAREAVPHGAVTIEVRAFRGPELRATYTNTYDFRFSANKLRAEARIQSVTTDAQGVPRRITRERVILFDGDACFVYSKANNVVSREARDPSRWGLLVLPRGMGMNPYLISSEAFRAGSFLAAAELDLTSATVDELGQGSTSRLRVGNCGFKGVFRVDLLFDPAKGMALEEAMLTALNTPERIEMKNSLRQFPGGVWYPERSVVTMHRNGKPFRRITCVTIAADFTETVDDRAFGLFTLDLPIGTVIEMEDGRPGVWDGNTVIDRDVWRAREGDRPRVSAAVPSTVMLGTVVLLSVGLAYVAYRQLSRRMLA